MFESELRVVEQAVRQAGEEIRRISKQGFETKFKANEDPLTTADLAANSILKSKLMGAFPTYGWLSEETQDEPSRLEKKRVWIVDPIDGTKEFVQGIPDYSISVALVEDGAPVIGIVYNPSTDEFFLAVKGDGTKLNGQPVHVLNNTADKCEVLASRSEIKRGEFDFAYPYFSVQPVGSVAYKLALVAAGKADATFSLTPKNEWDIAAGVLLVTEAGGTVVDKDGRPLRFNRSNTLLPGIIGSSAVSFKQVEDRIREYLADKNFH